MNNHFSKNNTILVDNNMNNNDTFLKNIEHLKTQYYDKSPKNFFLTKHQKNNCAHEIATKVNTTDLFSKTMFIIPNTNRVWVDYTIFKLYANPDNYKNIITYLLSLILTVINTMGSFEIHINLNSFTISAAERYRTSIQLFCEECVKLETRFANSLSYMYIYNTPSMMDSISAFFSQIMSVDVKAKIVLLNKLESPGLITQLLSF